MTQTLNRNPATTAVIQYDRHSYVPGGIVHPSVWSPRTDPQSPDINPPSGEFVSLASFYVHEADEAETQPVIDLAAAMPQPYAGEPEMHETSKPLLRRGRRRKVMPPDDLLLPLLALGVVGGLLMIAVQVALLQVAIRVSGAVL